MYKSLFLLRINLNRREGRKGGKGRMSLYANVLTKSRYFLVTKRTQGHRTGFVQHIYLDYE